MLDYADVLLPIGTFAETSGTFINAEGRWQSFAAAIRPPADTRPAWKVLRVLGNLLQVPGFDYLSSEEVGDELRCKVESVSKPQEISKWCPESLGSEKGSSLVRIAEVFIYGTDGLVRRSKALQESPDGQAARRVYINSIDADRLGLSSAKLIEVSQGDGKVTLPFMIDNTVAEGCLRLATGFEEVAVLGAPFAPIQVTMGE
jgi:NADH-quinone oxidoreductase subunit G